MTRYNIK